MLYPVLSNTYELRLILKPSFLKYLKNDNDGIITKEWNDLQMYCGVKWKLSLNDSFICSRVAKKKDIRYSVDILK